MSKDSPTEAIVLPDGAWRDVSSPALSEGPVGDRAVRRWGLAVFLCGTAFAVYGSLVPFNFEAGGAASIWEWIRDVPDRFLPTGGRIDFFSNICLGIPIGFGGMAWLTRKERSAFAVVSMTAVMAWALVMSLLIEGAQTLLPTRTASYSDVLAQSIGTSLGCVSWIVFGRTVRRWLFRLESAEQGHQRLELFLQGYLVVQFCMSVFPLDVTIHPADLYQKLQRGQINLIPFVGYKWNGDLVKEMLFFSFTSIPYGALATRLWVRSRTGLRNVADSLALGMAMVVGIELCQLFVASRFTDATQVVMGAAGVLVGVLMMHALWPHGAAADAGRRTWLQSPGTWLMGAMLYAFVPAAFLLWPFDFVFDAEAVRQGLRGMLAIPFDRLLGRSPLPLTTIFMRDVLLYLPLGLLLGAGIRWTKRSWRPVLVMAGGTCVVGVALGIEVLQTLVPGRTADVTSVLLSSVAGILGMAGLAFRSETREADF